MRASQASLISVLRQRSCEAPERLAFTFLAEGEAETDSLTYRALRERALSLANRLRERLRPGDRALLLYPSGLEFISAFLGCLSAGVVAVPVQAPRPNDRSLARLGSIARDAEPHAVLTTEALQGERGAAARAALPELERVLWWATDGPSADGGDASELPEPSLEDVAFLQYTSGSTSEPKGVVITHGNLVHNERMIEAAFAQDESSLVLGWLPLFHDMGLIGQVLQPLFAGGRCVLMAPAAFLQKPVRWLSAISRYRATTSGGPNFAYELCAAKVPSDALADLDLSSWRVAFNGAEPVRAGTLRRFGERFGSCGFRPEAFHPCYGLAEATLFVTGGASGRGPRSLSVDPAALERHETAAAEDGEARDLVSSGRAWLAQRLAVVDPQTGKERPEGAVGEIWVTGPSVARGYWRKPEATERDFHAVLRTRDGASVTPFLRTGDLGFLHDGELYVTGRLKDLIILRGRNHYPQDLELTAEQSHRELRPGGGVAFSVDIEGEERLVIVHEVERHRRDTPEEIAAAVRQAVAEGHEIQVHEVVLIRSGALPRTTSGKAQRRACRAAWLAGSLPVVGRNAVGTGAVGTATPVPDPAVLAALDPEDRRDLLEVFLRERVATTLGRAAGSVGITQPLTGLGLDSLSALQLKGQLETLLGATVPLDDLLAGVGIRELAGRLSAGLEARTGTAGETEEAIERTPPGVSPQPLSPGQQGLWLVDRLEPAEAALNIAVAARVYGLDPAVFRRALARVVARHEALRTVFEERSGEPVQRELKDARLDLRVEEAAGWSDEALSLRLDAEAWAPFDLEKGPLLRVHLFARGEGEWVLLWAIHHLVADFWSLALVARELAALYREEGGGPAASLPSADAAPRPADHVRWLERRLAGPRAEQLWRFWQQRLAGIQDLDLPADRPRPPAQTWRGHSAFRTLPPPLVEKLQEIGGSRSATLFMTLLSAFQTLLGRVSGQEAFAVGVPTAGRGRPELARMVGYLVNPLPLRADLAGSPTFPELLDRTREMALSALEHGELPFPWMARRLTGERDAARPPLYQTLFVFQQSRLGDDPGLAAFALGDAGSRISLGGAVLESMRLRQRRVQAELALWAAVDAEGGLLLTLDVNAELFESATAERLLGHLATLLAGAAEELQTSVWDLHLLTPAQRGQLLHEWGTGAPEPPRSRCLHELFEEQADRTPEAEAVVAGEMRLTYRELDRRANRLARFLCRLGVMPESRVGLCLSRSERMVEAMLGVLKAGGAYVPLDPAYPRERLALMLDDSGASLLVTEASLEFLGEPGTIPRLRLDADAARLAAESDRRPGVWVEPGHLAYLIYTSGSTGWPKAVAIEHRSPVARIRWAGERFGRDELSGVLAATSLCFDLSIFEIFVPLAHGGRVIVAADALDLLSLPAAGEVTLVNTVPSAMAALVRSEAVPSSVRTVNLAGEPIPPALAQAILEQRPARRLWNLYGPSEDTTYSTGARLTPGGGAPIGRPLAGTRVCLLDIRGALVPPGIPGEIFLGGAGLARGYLDRPEQTAERFVPDPFGTEAGGRLYRTGDLARWGPAGELEYLGRIDTQIKVRGFRVEIGEIEVALARHPAVQEAAVSLRGDLPGGSGLVSYIVPAAASQLDVAELHGYLRQCLPAYMVPAMFLCLESLPLTANGKVDRRALTALPLEKMERRVTGREEELRTPAEELLAGIWRGVLGLDAVGIHENFFRLGGDSILSLQVVARAGEAGYRLTPRHVLLHPTIAELAAALVAGGVNAEQGPVVGPVPLTPIQRWFFAAEPVEPHHWNQAVLLEVPADLDLPALSGAVRALVDHHDALRLRFRRGEEGWEQWSAAPEPEGIEVVRHDLSGVQETLLDTLLEEAASAFQASLDLTRGPLLRVAFVELGSGRGARLLVLAHHLAVDVVSWRILLEDLERGYQQLCAGEPVRLPAKTASYKQWAEHLVVLARTDALAAELEHWARLTVPGGAGRASWPDANTEGSVRVVSASLEEEETRALLVDVSQSYRTRIDEALLTALARGFARVQGLLSLRVDLEGHGREELVEALDVSRTVGWFTAIHPVLLSVDPAAGPGDSLKSIKEQLRSVPRHGVGYGMLRWLSGDERVAQALASVPAAEVSFNYLGQMSATLSSRLRMAGEPAGAVRSPRARRRYLLEVSAVVLDGRFRTDWSFSLDIHSRPQVEALVNGFMAELRSLIVHCRSSEAATFTPSDFPEMGFDQSELEDLLSDLNESAEVH